MLHFVWCSATFYLTVLVSNIVAKDKTNRPEKIFAGVIQNITRVNRVLQDLIHNYENLQKIYDSEEISDNIETNNTSQSVNKAERGTTAKKRSNLENNPATQMIWSIEKESNLDESSSSENETSITTAPTKTSTSEFKRAKQKTTQSELLLLLSSTESEEGHGLAIKFDNEINNTHENINDVAKQKPLKKEAKQKSAKLKVMNSTNKKMRFSIQHSYTPLDEKYKENNLYENNGANIKKALRTEYKNQHTNMSTLKTVVIVQGIVKPIQSFNGDTSHNFMTTQNVIVQSKTNHSSLILPKKETDILPPVKDEKTYSNEKVEDEYSYDDDSNLTDQVEILTKEEFNTDILRKAYGDACLKFVIKKCYKSCEDTLKSVCRTKCKNPVKKVFRKTYKGQCDTLFADVNYRSADRNKMLPYHWVSLKTVNLITCQNKLHFQITAGDIINRDLSTFCQLKLNNKTGGVNGHSNEKQLNVLRNKYEKACIKASREKCNDACTYSYKKACEASKCKEEKRRAFEKTCKQQCRVEFRGKYKRNKKQSTSSDSSESSSSSDESSD